MNVESRSPIERRQSAGPSPVSRLIFAIASVFAICLPAAVPAFNLTPIYLETENQLDGSSANRVPPFLRPVVANLLDQFADPAHEALTAVMFGCTGDFDACGFSDANPEAFVPGGVLDGLRWNDNPIFRVSTRASNCRGGGAPVFIDLDTDPLCWMTLFYDAGKRASGHPGEHFAGDRGNPPIALIYRVHYGDMQFLHSMASWDGETAAVTQAHILSWIEFTYKLHDGEIDDLDAPIVKQIPALAPIFERNGFSARSLMTPQALKASSDNDANLRAMALGSLLHTLEDSFSASHAMRDPALAQPTCDALPDAPVPGRISAFYAYNHQDGNKHKARDQSSAAKGQADAAASVVAVGKRVLALFDAGAPWSSAAPYFACLFAIAVPATPAAPGSYAPEA